MSNLNNKVLSIVVSDELKQRIPEMQKHYQKGSVSELVRYCLDIAYDAMKDGEVLPQTAPVANEVIPQQTSKREVLPIIESEVIPQKDKWQRKGLTVGQMKRYRCPVCSEELIAGECREQCIFPEGSAILIEEEEAI